MLPWGKMGHKSNELLKSYHETSFDRSRKKNVTNIVHLWTRAKKARTKPSASTHVRFMTNSQPFHWDHFKGFYHIWKCFPNGNKLSQGGKKLFWWVKCKWIKTTWIKFPLKYTQDWPLRTNALGRYGLWVGGVESLGSSLELPLCS